MQVGESSAHRATLLRRERNGKADSTGPAPGTLPIPVRQSPKGVHGMEWQPGRRGARSQTSAFWTIFS